MHGYENIFNIDPLKAVAAADAILSRGWTLSKYPAIQLDEIPWEFSRQEERSWNFHIHCLDMLDDLLMAHSCSGQAVYLKPSLAVAMDWIGKHGVMDSDSNSPMAWYDMAVGVRSYRLAYIFDACEHEGILDTQTREKLWNSLETHQAYLSDDENISFHNNHGFYQVAGQLALGRRFAPSSETMAEAYEQGQRRMSEMLRQQFAKDGVHREHSPDYHRMVGNCLSSIVATGLIEDVEVRDFLMTIDASLSWFVSPSKHLANFGDSDYRLLGTNASEAERKWSSPYMQYMVTGGEVGEAPEDDHVVFEDAGYFIVRKPSAEQPNDFSKMSYLAQIAAFHSRTHKHADDLSFIWSDRGHNILVDAGRYGYIGKSETGSQLWQDGFWYSDPHRVYCESTRAHNTLEFDGKNNKRKGVKPYGCALKRWLKTEDGFFAVETEIKQHQAIRQSRVLVFAPGQWLLVFDWFHDNNKQLHGVKQWFHLDPSLELEKAGDDYTVTLPSGEQPLRIASLLAGPCASGIYKGETEPLMQGWWSAKEKDIQPAAAFCYSCAGESTRSFATLFSFSEKLTGDTAWSRANITGRKARLRWSDERGCHTLHLDREQDELLVSYDSSQD